MDKLNNVNCEPQETRIMEKGRSSCIYYEILVHGMRVLRGWQTYQGIVVHRCQSIWTVHSIIIDSTN